MAGSPYDELQRAATKLPISPWRNSTMAKVRVGLVGCGFVSDLHMYAYKRVYGRRRGGHSRRGARRSRCRFRQEASHRHDLSQLRRSDRRPGHRRRRYLHAADAACGDDRRGDAGRQTRDLREAVRRLFRAQRRQDADRQARAEIGDVRARHGGDGQDLRRHQGERAGCSCTRKTGSMRRR